VGRFEEGLPATRRLIGLMQMPNITFLVPVITVRCGVRHDAGFRAAVTADRNFAREGYRSEVEDSSNSKRYC
jgi:hypothetical protein